MNFGKLDRQILLQAPTAAAQNGFGEVAPASFTNVGTVWAERKPTPAGTEVFQASEQTAVQPVVYQTRYRADVKPTWQFVDQGTTYHITAVAEIGRRVGLTLTAYSRG